MDIPFRLHRLKGRMRRYHAVSVSGNWRVAISVRRWPRCGCRLSITIRRFTHGNEQSCTSRRHRAEDCLKPLGLSVTEGAKRLGIGRQTLSNLVNGRASVSIEMAYRLSKAFGSTPETWLAMQLAFDLARSRHLEQKIKVADCCSVGLHSRETTRRHCGRRLKAGPPARRRQRFLFSSEEESCP